MSREKTEIFFGPEGPLRQQGGTGHSFQYEPRPQQVEMALAVADALDSRTNLCVEAPTGVGKTFAYLIPALFHAQEMHKAVVISTHTINLQEQIVTRDVPMIERMLNREIRAVVAKGRTHYLCLRRLNALFDLDQGLFDFDGKEGEIARLQRWADQTSTGDQGELPAGISKQLWDMVCCEQGNCAGHQCTFFKQCHLQRARRRLKDAELIIANHAKFFTETCSNDVKSRMGTGEDGVEREGTFPEFDGVILDEGHTIEDTASSHLGMTAESMSIRAVLNRLYSNDRKQGLLSGNDAYGALRDSIVVCHRQADAFFTRLVEWVEQQNKPVLRYQTPNHIKNYLAEALNPLLEQLKRVVKEEKEATIRAELQGALDSLTEQEEALDAFFPMSIPDSVYWMELKGKKNRDISLHIVPIDVGQLLRERLFASKCPVIVTSATLAVNNKIEYFQRRVGAEQAETLILDTPFHYQEQVKLYLTETMPEPGRPSFIEQGAEHLRYYLEKTGGRAFVLFTSYGMIDQMRQEMGDFFKKEKMTLLVQGEELTPRRMLEKFRTTEKAVIFGTSSFWTGVDVPGDALQNVIIMRLPFAVPDNPIVQARSERLREQGRNDFVEYAVPEAILKFRQGFGRLIRTRKDRGIVVVLDSRMATKPYGRLFLQSIPQCPIQRF